MSSCLGVKYICPEDHIPEDHRYRDDLPLSLKADCYKKSPSDFVNRMRGAADQDEEDASWRLTDPCTGMSRHITDGEKPIRVPINTDWCGKSAFKCQMPKAIGYGTRSAHFSHISEIYLLLYSFQAIN